MADLDINPQFLRALELIEGQGKHVFVTGRAGTGKSTLLGYVREHTAKRLVVLAPTGVAALNVGGQTIHSFFGFKPDITLSKVRKLSAREKDRAEICRNLETIVIDEISMVRADLLDCVDKFMRLNGRRGDLPFGGVQVVFFGDLYQLPPVVTRAEREIFTDSYASAFFFDAKLFEQDFEMELVELETIYRQRDPALIEVLNAIRNNSVTEEQLSLINQRCDPGFEAAANEFFIHLTTTNAMAADVNESRLAGIEGPEFAVKGVIKGDFDHKSLPTEISLRLKVGAQVMLLNNDGGGRWVNGSVGKIQEIDRDDELMVEVELTDGQVVEVAPFTWELFSFKFDKKNGIVAEGIGSFKQLPIRLAWAITVHKSQGKTFEKVIFDVGRGSFAHGQTYVALSRCTELGGLVLKKPLKKSHVIMDRKVVAFLTEHQYRLSERDLPLEEKIEILKQAARESRPLYITYLKAGDEKSHRRITPIEVGEMEYAGTSFIGVSAMCAMRRAERVFRVDRILEINRSLPA